MINYSTMDSRLNYGTQTYNDLHNSCNTYGSAGNYEYCPYLGYYNNGLNSYRGNCPYRSNYYQYSPTVNCIVPNYELRNNYSNEQGPLGNGELRIKTVSIEDVRD